jgi:predicted DNA-binding protein
MKYREKAIEAYGEECDVCEATEQVVVHHIDENRQNNSLDNLIPLCRSCHEKVHNNKLSVADEESITGEASITLEGEDYDRFEALHAAAAFGEVVPEGFVQEAVESHLNEQFDYELSVTDWMLERLQNGEATYAELDDGSRILLAPE